jgi:hypothetical protein
MSEASILQASGRMFDLYGLYGISVEGALDETVLEACRRSERLANYRQIASRHSGVSAPPALHSSPRSISRTSPSSSPIWPS